MAAESQAQLEQPAKVYQLQAVEAKLDYALKQLDVVVSQTSSLVTTAQLDEAKVSLREYIDEKVKDVDEKYKPFKDRWTALAGTALAAVVIQIVYIVFSIFRRPS